MKSLKIFAYGNAFSDHVLYLKALIFFFCSNILHTMKIGIIIQNTKSLDFYYCYYFEWLDTIKMKSIFVNYVDYVLSSPC